MWSSLTILLLAVYLVGSCRGLTAQNHQDSILQILQDIVRGQNLTNQRIDELQNQLAAIDVKLDKVQKCVLKDEGNAIQNTSVTEREVPRSCPEQLPTRNQVLIEADKCEEGGHHNCSAPAIYTDSLLHRQCSCTQGYSGDGLTCQDVDECTETTNRCGDEQICINYPGNFSCICPEGYKKDGNSCLDCASPSEVIPGLGCIVPVTRGMSWNEAQDNCNSMGARLLEGIKVEHFNLLTQHFKPQFTGWFSDPWIGVQGDRWSKSGYRVSSQEEEEEDLWKIGEPDGSRQGEDDCGSIELSYLSSGLHDYDCSYDRYSLCQFLY